MPIAYRLHGTALPPHVGQGELVVERQSEGDLGSVGVIRRVGRVLVVSLSVGNAVAIKTLAIILGLVLCDNLPRIFACSGGVLQHPSHVSSSFACASGLFVCRHGQTGPSYGSHPSS